MRSPIDVVLLFLAAVATLLRGAASQLLQSPCPSVLRYEPREEGVIDRWRAVITMTTDEELQGIWLTVNLDSKAHLLTNRFGEATTRDNKEYTIRDPAYTLEPGPGLKVNLEVSYSATERAPSVVRIRLNGRTICGNKRQSNVSVATPTSTTKNPRISTMTTTTTTQRTPTTRRRTVPVVTPPVSDTFCGDWCLLFSTQATTKHDLTREVPCGVRAKKAEPLVLHGQAAREGDWPWHVAIYTSTVLEQRYICGGSLVSKRHVVTAAHCVTKPGSRQPSNHENFLLHLGRTNLRKFGPSTQENRIEEIIVHPDYNYTYFHNDVALLRLGEEVKFNDFIRPVCLWHGDTTPVAGKLGTVVGWGFDATHKISEVLQETQLPVVDFQTCLYSNPDFFNKFTSRQSYCAGFNNGTSVCNGDSGGGMFFHRTGSDGSVIWSIRGLVSVSLALQRRFCDPYNYVVFTDLAWYTDWRAINSSGVPFSRGMSKLLLLLLSIVACVVGARVPKSPCPRLLQFENAADAPDRWDGVVVLSTQRDDIHGLYVDLSLDGTARNLIARFGLPKTRNNRDYTFELPDLHIPPNAVKYFRFTTVYEPEGPMPNVTTLRVNGRDVCKPVGVKGRRIQHKFS